MKLINTDNGVLVTIISIDGGFEFEDRLRQIGLVPGYVLEIIRKAPFKGPFLVRVNGRNIALGQRAATNINVEEIKCDLR